MTSKRIEGATRPDFAKIEFGGAVVTFARRRIDPIAMSLDNAMTEFTFAPETESCSLR